MALNPPASKRVWEHGPDGVGRYVTKFDEAPPAAVLPAVAPVRGVGPVATPAPAPAAPPPATDRTASLLDVTRNVGGIPGVNRITNPAQPAAAPLFTNIVDTGAAARGIYAEPGISAESLNRTLATSSVFNAPADPLSAARQAAAARGDFDAVDRSYRSDEEQVAHDLSQAHGAVGRGITSSLRNGVPAKIFPEMMAGLGALDTANARGAPDLGDYAALTNAQTSQGQLQVALERLKLDGATAITNAQTNAGNLAVNQAKLTQTQAADAARGERRALNDIAKISVNAETGLFDQTLFDQNLVQYGPIFGLGADTTPAAAAPTALDVASDAAEKLRKTGKYTEAQIQQVLKQRAGQ